MQKAITSHYYQQQVMTILKDKRQSFYLGICSLAIVGALTFLIAGGNQTARLADTRNAAKILSAQPATGPKTYIVQATDSLSSIAISQLGNEERWVDIARINNITDPNTVTEGQKLVLPTEVVGTPTPAPTAIPTETLIPTETPFPSETPFPTETLVPTVAVMQGNIGTGAMTKRAKPNVKEYTVQEGEGLWQIAEKVYGDGEMWVSIMNANNIQNPEQIYTGLKLKMPHIK